MEETNTILLIIQEITEGLLETLSFHEHFEKENMVFSTVIIANFLPSEFLIYTCFFFFLPLRILSVGLDLSNTPSLVCDFF